MADLKMCTQCGTLIDANEPSGLCAGCAGAASLSPDSDDGDGQPDVTPPLVHTDEPRGA